jgi:glutathione S-transferase
MIKLFQFPNAKDFPNYSPFCAKLEAYLKFSGLEYESIATMNLKNSPTKTFPYVELDNKLVGDSNLIIDELIQVHGDLVDNWLTKEQRIVGDGVKSILENDFVRYVIYYRWIDPVGLPQFFDRVFARSHKLVKLVVGGLLAKRVGKKLGGFNGVMNYTSAQRLILAAKSLDTVNAILGDKEYLFGDKPSSYDAILFGIFGTLALTDIEMDLKCLSLKYPTLVGHSQNILNKYFIK